MAHAIGHRVIGDDLILVVFQLLDRLEHEDEHEICERASRIQMASVVPYLYIKIVQILLGQDVPHGRVRMVRQVRILGDVIVNELEDVTLMRDHHVIGMGEPNHRIVPEHRGGYINSVMVLMRASVRRFQGPIYDRRRCVSSANELQASDEHAVRDDIRARTRSERVQPIPHPRDLTHFQNLRLLEAEGFPNRVGVLILHQEGDRLVLGPTIEDKRVLVRISVVRDAHRRRRVGLTRVGERGGPVGFSGDLVVRELGLHVVD